MNFKCQICGKRKGKPYNHERCSVVLKNTLPPPKVSYKRKKITKKRADGFAKFINRD